MRILACCDVSFRVSEQRVLLLGVELRIEEPGENELVDTPRPCDHLVGFNRQPMKEPGRKMKNSRTESTILKRTFEKREPKRGLTNRCPRHADEGNRGWPLLHSRLPSGKSCLLRLYFNDTGGIDYDFVIWNAGQHKHDDGNRHQFHCVGHFCSSS